MNNTGIILSIFFRVGYDFSALVLVLLFLVWKARRPELRRLVAMANGLLAFYALCGLMVGIAEVARRGFYPTILWQLLPLLAMALLFFAVRRNPFFLVLPFFALVTVSLFRDELVTTLASLKPYVLVLMAFLYLLLVYGVDLLGQAIRKAAGGDTR